MDAFSKQLNFEFEPIIDITTNLDQKFRNFLYNFTHFKAGRFILKPRFLHRYYSQTIKLLT